MELVLKVFDFLSTGALYLILLIQIILIRRRKQLINNRKLALEMCYNYFSKPLVRPAVIFALIREHYYVHGQETKFTLIGSVIMALIVLTFEFTLKIKLEQESKQAAENKDV